jgi:DNA-binding SARP family transcriptional activator/streptogramin lyase
VEFRILGPLEVGNGHDAGSLDAPKVRALLGVLLLHPNEVVSNARLIDELWGDQPPATAAKIVQTYVSQLRRMLDPDTIATRTPGYVLHVDAGALDSARFRDLVAEARRLAASGDQEEARRVYQDALALWRGPPLADLLFESFARNEVEQLDEERLSARMDLIDCELELGHHEEVVPELETLVRQYPLRERLRAQLMLALYRCGRQADALAAYQDARRTLVDELGLEPSRELHDLEQAILTHARELEAPRRATPPLQHLKRWRAPLAIIAIGVTLAVILAFALGGGPNEPSLNLASNSVGFIDARSGRVTRSFTVGRAPSSLTVADNSVWVANSRDQTVTRIDRTSGAAPITIPVGGHPTALVALNGTIWVLTLEGTLVPIDPSYDTPGTPVALGIQRFIARSPAAGRIAAGGGFLWVTAPEVMVLRIDPANPRSPRRFVPDSGARGPIAFHDGKPWVAGEADSVFSIEASNGVIGHPITVGGVRGLAFGAGSLWVVSGGPGHIGGVRQALRRIDTVSELVQMTIPVGNDPVAVAVEGGSVWVASRSDQAIERVDAEQNRVVDSLRLGSAPVALAPDENGVWVATD